MKMVGSTANSFCMGNKDKNQVCKNQILICMDHCIFEIQSTTSWIEMINETLEKWEIYKKKNPTYLKCIAIVYLQSHEKMQIPIKIISMDILFPKTMSSLFLMENSYSRKKTSPFPVENS